MACVAFKHGAFRFSRVLIHVVFVTSLDADIFEKLFVLFSGDSLQSLLFFNLLHLFLLNLAIQSQLFLLFLIVLFIKVFVVFLYDLVPSPFSNVHLSSWVLVLH